MRKGAEVFTSAPFSVSIICEILAPQTGFFPTLGYAHSPRYINPRNGNIRTLLQNLHQRFRIPNSTLIHQIFEENEHSESLTHFMVFFRLRNTK